MNEVFPTTLGFELEFDAPVTTPQPVDPVSTESPVNGPTADVALSNGMDSLLNVVRRMASRNEINWTTLQGAMTLDGAASLVRTAEVELDAVDVENALQEMTTEWDRPSTPPSLGQAVVEWEATRPSTPTTNEVSRLQATTIASRVWFLHELHEKLLTHGYASVNVGHWRRTAMNSLHWDLKTDSSAGLEAASPVISRYSELQRHARVASIVDEAGGFLTSKCGLHYHVGVSCSWRELEGLLKLCLRYQYAFFAMVSTERRQSRYCKPVTHEMLAAVRGVFKSHPDASPAALEALMACWPDKDVWLNLKTLPRGTIEFRLPEATLDPRVVESWGLLLMHIMDLVKQGYRGRWGHAKAMDLSMLFRSFLAAGGFYKPAQNPVTRHRDTALYDRERAVVVRRWAWAMLHTRNADLSQPYVPAPTEQGLTFTSRPGAVEFVVSNYSTAATAIDCEWTTSLDPTQVTAYTTMTSQYTVDVNTD